LSIVVGSPIWPGITVRTAAERKTARKQITFHGDKQDIDLMRAAFQLA
jgi:hypothetical protein